MSNKTIVIKNVDIKVEVENKRPNKMHKNMKRKVKIMPFGNYKGLNKI